LYDGSSGLDLDEGQQVAPPGNEIDIVTAQLEPMSLDIPPTGDQVSNSRPLTPEATYLP
jgi:hypothetical protein